MSELGSPSSFMDAGKFRTLFVKKPCNYRKNCDIMLALLSAMKKITTPVNFNGGCLESPEGAEAGGRENQRREKNERYFNETVT